MDPITIIVTALAAGAAAGLKPTAEQAITDAYSAVKGLIKRKYGILSIETLEQKPSSQTKRASVTEDLQEAGAGSDAELLDHASALLEAVKTHDPGVAAKLDINLEEIVAAYFKLKRASGKGDVNVSLKKSTFSGGIDIEGLSAGSGEKKK